MKFTSGPWRIERIADTDSSPIAIEIGPSRVVFPQHEARLLAIALMSITDEA